ncbi:MAG: glutamate--tRNA ligase [Gammaproteobacteria bacterium]|nr:glutamate--tRNA ligase [Gammaproteobacteria bacterium]
MPIMIKTRFAPSPTGKMHLGNIRTALFNVLFAQKMKGCFVLRIEDTDKERSNPLYTEHIQEDLKWLGLEWQEGPGVGGPFAPYFQSERQTLYHAHYQTLIGKNLAYPCFCTDSELAWSRKAQLAKGHPPRYTGLCRQLQAHQIQNKFSSGEKPTLRFKVPENETIHFQDLIKGAQTFQTNSIGDFIIRRSDQTAPFLFCNAVDDALMQITHVIRGEDHLANTPRQILLLTALNLSVPLYAHIPLVLGQGNSPLSKRSESQTVSELREVGFFPLAILNYLARLGHAYDTQGFLSRSELANGFDFERFSVSAAHFDDLHLEHWQKNALLKNAFEDIWQWLPLDVQVLVPTPHKETFVSLLRFNVKNSAEVKCLAKQLFSDPLAWQEDAQKIIQETPKALFEAALVAFERYPHDYAKASFLISEKTQFKGKSLHQPIRAALLGALHGPELKESIPLLKQESILSRLKQALVVAL